MSGVVTEHVTATDEQYRAITISPVSTDGARYTQPISEAVVVCRGCAAGLTIAIASYGDLVRTIERSGGRYLARPVEQVWCPACRQASGPLEANGLTALAAAITRAATEFATASSWRARGFRAGAGRPGPGQSLTAAGRCWAGASAARERVR